MALLHESIISKQSFVSGYRVPWEVGNLGSFSADGVLIHGTVICNFWEMVIFYVTLDCLTLRQQYHPSTTLPVQDEELNNLGLFTYSVQNLASNRKCTFNDLQLRLHIHSQNTMH